MKKHLSKLITVLMAAALIFSTPAKTGIETSAEVAAPYELGSTVTIGDTVGGKNIVTSTFEAVNLTVLSQPAEGNNYQQYVDYELATEVTDFSSATSIFVQIGNNFWGGFAVNIMLMDGEGHCVRVIGENYCEPSVNQEKGQYATKFYTDLDGAAVNTTYPGYGFENIPALFSGYMELQLNDFAYEWGATTFDRANVTKVIVELDTQYNPNTKLNVGNIYVKGAESAFTKVYDVTKAAEGFGTANNYGKWSAATDKSVDHVKANLVGANQIKTFANFTSNNNQWSDFYMLMPTDISNYNGISYYVENTSSVDVFFNKFIREGANGVIGEEWYCDAGFATFIPTEGEQFKGDTNVIPAGFCGTVVVPFTNFLIPSWGGVDNNVLDLNNVWWNFGFTFDVSRGSYAFVFKNVKLVSDAFEYIRLPQTVATYGDTKIVLPFDYYDDYDLGSDWATHWDKASPCTIECVDSPASDVTGAGGKAMKFTCGTMLTIADASNETALEHYPSGEQTDISGAKGITYYVKNLSASQIGFNFGFDLLVSEGVQQRWTTKMNARYTLYDVKTGAQRVLNGKNGIYVPAGFEGYVRIDFTQYTNPTWETNGSAFNDEFKVAYMVINMNAVLHEGESFILDSIGYYYSETQISTTFNSSTNTIADAMNS